MTRNIVSLSRGSSEGLGSKAIAVDVQWTLPCDIDLAALCVSKESKSVELIYHGNEGRRLKYPFGHLFHESVSNSRTKYRREHLVMVDHSVHDEVHLFVWDHEAASKGTAIDHEGIGADLSVTVVDQFNRVIEIPVDGALRGKNCLLVASIESGQVFAGKRGVKIEGGGSHIKSLLTLAGIESGVQVTC